MKFSWRGVIGVIQAVGSLTCVGGLIAAEPARLVVTHALLFTQEKGQETPFTGHMVIDADGRIQTVAPGDPPAAVVSAARTHLDAEGKWVLPGFISAHSHLWQSAYRGLASDQTLMGWVESVYMKNAVNASAENFYWFTLHGALDHLRNGITGAYNFNYSAQNKAGRFAEEQFRAECDSGLRFVHGFNVGRMGAEWTLDDARRQTAEFLKWINAQPPSAGFLSAMINGAAAFVRNPEQARLEAVLMKEFDLGNQAHFLESPPDKFEERARFRWFLDAGLLSRKLFFGHFVHADPWILHESVKAGVGMSWNPLSNGRLASGIADIPAYVKAGLRIGMGVDGQASADRADPFENMRMGLYQVRAKYENAAVLSPADVLRMHTLGSAEVLGVQDRLGSLVAGKLADFIVVDPADLGPVFDPHASLVFVAGVRDIERIYVGGELKVLRGSLLGRDFAAVRAEVMARVKAAARR